MFNNLRLSPPEMLQTLGLHMNDCPICGAAAHVSDNIVKGENGGYFGLCYECGNSTDEHADPRGAIDQWNKGAMIDAGI